MPDELRRYNKWNTVVSVAMLLTGLRPSDNASTLYRLVVLVHGLSTLAMCCVLFNFSHHNITDLHLFFKGFSMAFSFLTVLQKIICFTVYRKQLAELHARLADTFGQDLNEPQLRASLLSPLKSFYRPLVILVFVMFTNLGCYYLAPVIFIVVQYFRNVDVIKLELPFPTRYPWSVTENCWFYLLHYVFEIYAGACLMVFTILIDSLFGYYVFQISGQFRSLSYRIINVKSNKDYCKVIKACVVRHQILIRCQHLFERIYGPIVLWILITNAIVLCAQFYHVSLMDPKSAGMIVVYMLVKVIQALSYALCGTYLTTESDMFREAIYASDWAGSGEKPFMIDVLVMISQKPMVMRACSVSTVSAEMFVAICNAAVSYFFIIRTLEAGGRA